MSAAAIVALPDCAERLEVARNAAWEIESLASFLQDSADSSGGTVDRLVLRGFMMRMKTLAGVVMAAVEDEIDPLSELQFRLVGPRDKEGDAA